MPIICCFGVPSSSALMKSPAAGMNEQRARDDPGRGERSDAEEGAGGARVEVLRRLEQPRVDLLERDVERQGHEGEEVVGDPRDHGERRVEEALALAEQVQLAEADHRPSSARMLSQASVLIR